MSCSYLRVVTIGFHADRSTRFPTDCYADTGRLWVRLRRPQARGPLCLNQRTSSAWRSASVKCQGRTSPPRAFAILVFPQLAEHRQISRAFLGTGSRRLHRFII